VEPGQSWAEVVSEASDKKVIEDGEVAINRGGGEGGIEVNDWRDLDPNLDGNVEDDVILDGNYTLMKIEPRTSDEYDLQLQDDYVEESEVEDNEEIIEQWCATEDGRLTGCGGSGSGTESESNGGDGGDETTECTPGRRAVSEC